MRVKIHTTHLSYGAQGSILILVILASFFLEFLGFLQPIRWAGERFFQPLVTVNAGIARTIQFPFYMVTQSFSRAARLQDLELRYAESLAQLGERDLLKKENEELRRIIGEAVGSGAQKPSIGSIISYGQPAISFQNSEKVREGASVLSAGTLIGRIGAISELQAELILLTSSYSEAVLVKTESGVTGVVMGNGKDVVLKEVPIEAELKEGERVMSIGQPGIQPGIFVGRIQVIQKEDGASTQEAILDQVVSFYQSSIVEIR